jgi:hypothetical protein
MMASLKLRVWKRQDQPATKSNHYSRTRGIPAAAAQG